MPHLSPMKWLLMLLTIWTLTLFISSLSWWSQHPLWPPLNKHTNQTKSNPWMWTSKVLYNW